ncbi:DUF2254 domain-containing protein [Pseudosporangium ferrugineum]|uniref:Putative membrane protein n=1 Tax=Pseudosporangium ferrugineum TaxID=439699 RepID=A0A2T0RGF0_9ACTN|nr:DUF2254 domain-containing protein [Pseudosporangium ferrugineum]PRY20201.1 putative membrane protein [Pseudosporangium ferrugineum]
MTTLQLARLTRGRAVADGLRTQLWPMPAAAIVLAIALGAVMPVYDNQLLRLMPAGLGSYLFGGGPEAARSVLQAIAGSLITVTSLTFSLTIVTLQLASGQYSPRLLRTFARDRVVHATLAVLLATFTYALTVLRTVRDDRSTGAFVPRLSVTTAYLLALVSVLAVAGFLAHLARKIRVESMLRDVHAEAVETVRQTVRTRDGSQRSADPPAPPHRGTLILCAPTSGFVTSVNDRKLLAAAVRTGTVIRVDRAPGASVVAGTPVATAWRLESGEDHDDDGLRDVLHGELAEALGIGFERTSTQDIAFGLRQLTDVVAKALSPGINDPTTAVHALGHSSALLCEAARHDLRPATRHDDAGRVRVVLARPDLAGLLDLAVSQPRRYGAAHPEVLIRLFDLLRELAWVLRDDRAQLAPVAAQLARLRATVAGQDFDEVERAKLSRRADSVDAALEGRWPADD